MEDVFRIQLVTQHDCVAEGRTQVAIQHLGVLQSRSPPVGTAAPTIAAPAASAVSVSAAEQMAVSTSGDKKGPRLSSPTGGDGKLAIEMPGSPSASTTLMRSSSFSMDALDSGGKAPKVVVPDDEDDDDSSQDPKSDVPSISPRTGGAGYTQPLFSPRSRLLNNNNNPPTEEM
jgi:hypothetical protein